MVIQIMNYDRPSITVFDPSQDITIDSAQLKAKGVIVANFDIYTSEAYLIIKDSNNEYLISTDSLSDLSGQYDLLVKNNDNGQAVVLSGLVFENSNNRTIYFSILAAIVLFLTFGVIKLYIRRSNKKTIFDEYE